MKYKQAPEATGTDTLPIPSCAASAPKATPSADSHLDADMEQTLHALHVHQAELESQNDELRRIQSELELQRERYFNLYDMAPVGYCSVSEQGLILEANLTAAKLLQAERGRMVQQPFSRFILSADQDIYYRCRQLLLDSGKAQQCELRMAPKSGKVFWAKLMATLMPGAEGDSVLRLVLSDISERKSVEAALALTRLELTQSQRMAHLGNWSWDLGSGVHTWSDEIYAIYDQPQALGPLTYPQIASHFTPSSWHTLSAAVEQCRLHATPYHCDAQLQHTSGAGRWLNIFGMAVIAPGGAITLHGTVQDITERKLADLARGAAVELLNKISSRVPGLVYQFLMRPDGSSCFPFASEAIRDVYRVSPEEVRTDASKVFDNLHPDDLSNVAAGIQASARNLTPWQQEYRVQFADGTVNWLLGNAVPQRESNGDVIWHGFITDVSRHKAAELALKISEQSLRTSERQMVISQQISATGSWSLNLDTKVVWGSAEAMRLFGYPSYAHEIPLAEIESCIPERDRVHAALLALINEEQAYDLQFEIHPVDGSPSRTMHSVARMDEGESGGPALVLGFIQDVTLLRQMDEQIRQLAFFDPLTGLPNRRLFMDRLGQAITGLQRSARYGTLMFVDLDNFKPLNDRHGHAAGDLLLSEVALRLNQSVRETDTVSRFGGDEFVLLMEGQHSDYDQAMEYAKSMAEKIRLSLAKPYLLVEHREHTGDAGIQHHCTASIGVAVFSKSDQDPDAILKWADAAMYQAKSQGRNTLCIHPRSLL